MRVKVILNPFAGQGKAEQHIQAVQSTLSDVGIQSDLVLAQQQQVRLEAIIAAYGDYDAVVVAGGDGTLHDAVNGLMIASSGKETCPLGILPLGTANDFCKMAGLPRNLKDAVSVIAQGFKRQIDVGSIKYFDCSCTHGSDTVYRGCFFDNNCALAMESIVTQTANKLAYPRGKLRYVIAVAKTLSQLKAWDMQILWDAGAYEGLVYLLSVSNTPRTRSLFMISPEASMEDGFLDFVFIPVVPKIQVLALLPRLISGSHIQHPQVVSGRTTRLHVKSQPSTPIHADGEIISEGARTVDYQILPGKITLLAPH